MRKFYSSYQQLFESLNSNSSKIYRGQSNIGEEWKIKSLYNRSYSNGFNFEEIGRAIRRNISAYHRIAGIDKVTQLELVDLLIYLQHYGVPTPFIDFSRSVYTSFYFACSSISYGSVRKSQEFLVRKFTGFGDSRALDNRYKACFDLATNLDRGEVLSDDEMKLLYEYQPDYFVTLVELDIKQLNECKKLALRDIEKQDLTYDFINAQERQIVLEDGNHFVTFFSIEKPEQNSINQNLGLQDGLFLYLDSDISLEEVLHFYDLDSALIKHLVPKPVLNPIPYPEFQRESIFEFLKKQGSTGKDLFNDLQGLKYDLLNYYPGQ